MILNRRILNNVLFHSITFQILSKKYMLATGWSLKKKDWWYHKDPSTVKFFDIRRTINTKTINYGLYIGRFALVLMKDKE